MIGSKNSESTNVHLLSKIIFGISLCYFALTRWRFLDIPLDRDEGTYLYLGSLFMKGYIPYVDFYEIKPPGIFLVYGIYDILFGFNNFTLHLGLVLVQIGLAYLVYKIAIKLYHNIDTALIAASIFLLSVLIFNLLGFAILSEYFFIAPILGCILLLLQMNGDNIRRNTILAGVCLGLAALIRQHAIFFLIPILYLVFVQSKILKTTFIHLLVQLLVGGLMIVVPMILYIVARGSLDEMIYWVVSRPNKTYVGAVTWSEGQRYLFTVLRNISRVNYILVALFIIGLVHLLYQLFASSRPKSELIFSCLFLIASFATVFPGLRFYGHYWLMFVPAFALVGSQAYAIQYRTVSHFIPIMFTILIGIHIVSTFALNCTTNTKLLYKNIYGKNPNASLPPLIKYINKIKKPEDGLYVFGSEPQVYYETNTVVGTPHCYVGYAHIPGETNEKYQEEIIQYIDKSKPKYILHLQNVNSINMKDGSSQNLYKWIYMTEQRFYSQVAVAEINGQNVPTYYYDDKAVHHKPASDNYIILYKRND